MSDQNKSGGLLPIVTGVILVGGTILVAVLGVITLFGGEELGDDPYYDNFSMKERIEPVGKIASGADAAASAAVETAAVEEEVIDGKSTYESVCAMCHGTGIAGAPKAGDAAAWSDRIAKGNDVLYVSAISGFQGSTGMMPAKGGRADLSDEAVKAAVDHMVGLSQ